MTAEQLRSGHSAHGEQGGRAGRMPAPTLAPGMATSRALTQVEGQRRVSQVTPHKVPQVPHCGGRGQLRPVAPIVGFPPALDLPRLTCLTGPEEALQDVTVWEPDTQRHLGQTQAVSTPERMRGSPAPPDTILPWGSALAWPWPEPPEGPWSLRGHLLGTSCKAGEVLVPPGQKPCTRQGGPAYPPLTLQLGQAAAHIVHGDLEEGVRQFVRAG